MSKPSIEKSHTVCIFKIKVDENKLKKLFSIMFLILLLTSTLILMFNIQKVKAEPGTIYIRADGSIDPPTAPIKRVGDVYTFTDNIYDSIVVERDNIIIDGAGYMLQGRRSGGGITLSGRTNVTIRNMQIKNFLFGIYFNSSFSNIIIGNNITNNYYNIYFNSSSNNIISKNNITSSNEYGIRFDSSFNNRISENNITSNSARGIVFNSSSNNIIIGNNIAKSTYDGIYLRFSSNNSIIGNNIANTEYGIHFYSSSKNSIIGNDIARHYYGIYLHLSSNNIIIGNNITSNGYYGIWLYMSSNYNIVSENSITNNEYGIYFSPSSSYNIIKGNSITNNRFGIYLHSSSNNRFYHNNFINKRQVNYEGSSINVWDDGYPSGGNYWSNYTGVDANGDCIGDTPYVIYENNTDHYPLMRPWLVVERAPFFRVVNILSPQSMYAGDEFHIQVVANYSSSFKTLVRVEVWNYTGKTVEAYERIDVKEDVVSGNGTKTFDFKLRALSSPGTMNLVIETAYFYKGGWRSEERLPLVISVIPRPLLGLPIAVVIGGAVLIVAVLAIAIGLILARRKVGH